MFAENRYGMSTPLDSQYVKADNQFSPPKAPTNLHASNVASNFVELAWKSPTDDGGNILQTVLQEQFSKMCSN